MIPEFPQFKKLELSDQKDIEDLTRPFPPYSDFDFVSLWSYDTDHLVEVSTLSGNLVLKFQDYLDLEMFYTFLGTNNVDTVIHTLLAEAKKNGLKPFLKLIPKTCIESLSGESDLLIQESRDDFDYVIDCHAFSMLVGGEYRSKRQEVYRFLDMYSETAQVEELDLRNKTVQQEILDLFQFWIDNFDKNPLENAHEYKATQKLFSGIDSYEMNAFGLRVEGKLIGYILSRVVNHKYAMLEFGKWNMKYRGCGEFLQREAFVRLEAMGCTLINYEQDLGIEGLRHAKELCKPIFFLKKYRVSLKETEQP